MAGLSPIADLAPGAEIGSYVVEAEIGRGAMGSVHRARDLEAGGHVALKRLTDVEHAARFEVEARLLAQLDHPRVVKVVDHFRAPDSTVCLVMDLVDGADLGEVVKQRGSPGLPVDECVEYGRQACEALQYVHEQQIVHRDVKPANLILGPQGVVVVDFGVATPLGRSGYTVAIGTPRFMAPEVFAGGALSPRSDVFSLAATLWTMIAGEPPGYADETSLADRIEGVDRGLEDTLRAGMELVPDRRIASAEAFAAALGAPLDDRAGRSLFRSAGAAGPEPRPLLEAVVRTAAAVFEAAAASIALIDGDTHELVYQAAWGAGAGEIAGVRLPLGAGVAGAVVASGQGEAVPDCRADDRFEAQIAAGTGYVPNTMLVVPLTRDRETIGALSVLDRRDGGSYGVADVGRAEVFAELAVAALEAED